MTPEAALWLACVAAEVAALGLGVVHADRLQNSAAARLRTVLRSPLVHLLAAAVAIDLSVAALGLAFDGLPRPLHGWSRAAYHFADALVMAWPCAVAWTAVAIFSSSVSVRVAGASIGSEALDGLPKEGLRDGRRRQEHRQHEGGGETKSGSRAVSEVQPQGRDREDEHHGLRDARRQHPHVPMVRLPARAHEGLTLLAGLYLAAVVALAACYPIPGRDVQRVLLTVELAAVVAAWRAVYLGRGAPWRLEHRAIVWLLSFETMVASVGPFGRDVFRDWSTIGAGIYLCAFAGVAVMLGRAVRRA